MSSGLPDRSDRHHESRGGPARGQNKGSDRNWSDARIKVDDEGCRLRGHVLHVCDGEPEAAHTIGRRYDEVPEYANALWVNPDSIVPLCRNAHREYDAHRLDILPYLTLDEQADAVRRVGLIRALARLSGGAGLVASQNPQGEEEA